MTSSVIFKKNKETDELGFLYIQYRNGALRPKISLKEKVSADQFKKYFNKDLNLFNKTTVVDYKRLNSKILEKIDDFSIFNLPKKAGNSQRFVSYIEEKIAFIPNPNTRSLYNVVFKKMYAYLKLSGSKEISFEDLNLNFFLAYNMYLNGLKTMNGNTIKTHFTVIKGWLNTANAEGIHQNNINFMRHLSIKVVKNLKPTLSENDINKLLATSVDNKEIYTIQVGLFQLFCQGIRQSDALLMRNENFQGRGIVFLTKKNLKFVEVEYTQILLNILFTIFDLNKEENSGFKNQNQLLTDIYYAYRHPRFASTADIKTFDKFLDVGWKQHQINYLLNYISNLPSKEFLFKKIVNSESLKNYDKEQEMSSEQHSAFFANLVYYSQHLKKVKSNLDLEISSLTSHVFRYTYTKLMLETKNVNLLDVSRSLTHSSLATTNRYIQDGFGSNRKTVHANQISDRFDLSSEKNTKTAKTLKKKNRKD